MILQCCREEKEIIICADPANLRHNTTWSRWTDILLDKFCPRVDWENRRANFIVHLKSDMEIADQVNQWFKFKLHFEGGTYKSLEHTVFTRKKFIRRDVKGKQIESIATTREIPLNYKVESKFCGEFICEPNPMFQGSDVERCFSPFLYPPQSPE